MSFNTIGFVGLGLIGGSIAKALKRVHPEKTVVAYNRNGSVLDLAAEDGIVDIAVKDETVERGRIEPLLLVAPPDDEVQRPDGVRLDV